MIRLESDWTLSAVLADAESELPDRGPPSLGLHAATKRTTLPTQQRLGTLRISADGMVPIPRGQ